MLGQRARRVSSSAIVLPARAKQTPPRRDPLHRRPFLRETATMRKGAEGRGAGITKGGGMNLDWDVIMFLRRARGAGRRGAEVH